MSLSQSIMASLREERDPISPEEWRKLHGITTTAQWAKQPMRGAPPDLGPDPVMGGGPGSGWDPDNERSRNASYAIYAGKLPEPEFREWLADQLGIPVRAITRQALSLANSNAQNIFREYHHVKVRGRITSVEFYDPAEILESPKFFLGLMGGLKSLSHQRKARKAALGAWQRLRQSLSDHGLLGQWHFNREERPSAGILDQLRNPAKYKDLVKRGEMGVEEAMSRDWEDYLASWQDTYERWAKAELETLRHLELGLKRYPAESVPDKLLRKIEASKERSRSLRTRWARLVAENAPDHPAREAKAWRERYLTVQASPSP